MGQIGRIFYFSVVLNSLSLLLGQFFRDHDLERDDVVAFALVSVSESLESSALNRVLLVVSCASDQVYLLDSFHRLDLNISAKNSLGHGNLDLGVDVITLPYEFGVLLQGNLQDQIASLSVESLVASLSDSKKHSVINGFRNFDGKLNFLLEDSIALARAALLDLGTTAETRLTNITLIQRVDASTLAGLADHVVSCLFDPISIAGGADDDTVIGHSFLHSSESLSEIN